MSHTSATTLLGIARDLSRLTPTPISHCRAHVERWKKDPTEWSYEELGNYIADKAASGLMADIATIYPSAIMIRDEVMNAATELIGRADWLLTMHGSPCTPSLRKAQKTTHSKE